MQAPPGPPCPWPPGFQPYRLELSWGQARLLCGGSGPALFLVHGLGGCAEDFRQLAALLAGSFTCLIPDLPGFGLSSKPDVPYSPDFFAQALGEMARELGLNSALWLGHSLGGHSVLKLAVSQPDLARKVVAVCPSGGHLAPCLRQRLALTLATPEDRLRLFHPLAARWSVSWIFGEPLHGPNSAVCRETQQRIAAQWVGPERPLLERAFIRSGLGALAQPVWPLLPSLRAPLLLIAGQGDRVIPAEQTDRLRLHAPPGSSYLSMRGGHMPPFLAAWELARAVLSFAG